MMKALIRTIRFIFKAQMRNPLFYIILAALLACAVIPLFAGESSELAAVICDGDGTARSCDLVRQAKELQTLRLAETDEYGLPAALDRLKSGAVEAVFVVEKGYAENLMNGQYRGAVKLYLSPYSTSASTLSDAVAAIVMRQWLAVEVQSRAAAAQGEDAGGEAAKLYAAGSSPIILLDVEGEAAPAASAGTPVPQAKNALLLLAALACFMLLCFPASGAQDTDAMLDRFAARGWHISAYFLARSALAAAPAGIAALIPSIAIAASSGAVVAYPLFLLYLLAWVGAGAALDGLIRNTSVRLAAASIAGIFNAMLLYPEGLSQMMGPARGVFAGYWFAQAIQGDLAYGLLALSIFAVCTLVLAIAALEIRDIKTRGNSPR